MSHPAKKYPFSRRNFLRGAAGVTIALPMLDIFGRDSAQAQNAPGFLVFMRQGNGCSQASGDEPEMFWPTQFGALSATTMGGRAVEVLQDIRQNLLIIKGVNRPFDGAGCGHAAGAAQLLTAQKVSTNPGGKDTLAYGESVDNRVARELNPAGREPLTLMAGVTNAYIGSALSYRGALDRRGAETNPWNAFQRIIGLVNVDDGSTMVANEIATRRKSANDFVREQMNTLLGRNDLSSLDRERLDLHFSSIRDMELQMSAAQCVPLASGRVNEFQQMSGNHENGSVVVQVAEMHIDLVAFALSCGYTSSATLQVGTGNDQTRYVVNGQTLPPFHQISHRIYSDGATGDPLPDAQNKHAQIDRIHGRLFKRLVDKVNAYGILNKGVLAWVNDLANGPPHGRNNLPFILAGNANGYLKSGQFVDAGGVTLNKMHNTLMNAIGIRKAGGAVVTSATRSCERRNRANARVVSRLDNTRANISQTRRRQPETSARHKHVGAGIGIGSSNLASTHARLPPRSQRRRMQPGHVPAGVRG
ncbi:MAG: DUF1552 domain-containing protein [Polyangiales bacterium]